jgi:hypothetical protein
MIDMQNLHEMQRAEKTVRAAIGLAPGEALQSLFDTYARGNSAEKDALVAVLIARVVTAPYASAQSAVPSADLTLA